MDLGIKEMGFNSNGPNHHQYAVSVIEFQEFVTRFRVIVVTENPTGSCAIQINVTFFCTTELKRWGPTQQVDNW